MDRSNTASKARITQLTGKDKGISSASLMRPGSRASSKVPLVSSSSARLPTPGSAASASIASVVGSHGAAAAIPAPADADNKENIESSEQTQQLQVQAPRKMPEGWVAGVSVSDGDIEPLFITAASKELFGLTTVSAEDPFRLLARTFLLADIQNRGAISDFHAARDKIKAYPTDELLLVYDAEQIHGQNFFLVASEPRKSDYLRWMELQETDAGATAEEKEIQVREWQSLGSETEVQEISVVSTRPLVVMEISRERREFGAPFKFSDRDAHDGLLECRPFKDPNFELKRMEDDVGVQAVPTTDSAATQTAWFRPVNSSTQYQALELPSETRESVEAAPSLGSFCTRVLGQYQLALQQNETMDVFQDDFLDLADEDTGAGPKADNSIKEFQSFTDIVYSRNKKIAAIDWQPGSRGVVAVSCSARMSFEQRLEVAGKVSTSVVLVWSFADPIHPQYILESPVDVATFRFHPLKPHLIAGGTTSGQVLLWDVTDARSAEAVAVASGSGAGREDDDQSSAVIIKPAAISNIETSHRASVTDLAWVPEHQISSKGEATRVLGDNGEAITSHLATLGVDGNILFWDINATVREGKRNGPSTWAPHFSLPLSKVDVSGRYGGLCMSLAPLLSAEAAQARADAAAERLAAAAAGSGRDRTKSASPDADEGTTEVSRLVQELLAVTEEGELVSVSWERGVDAKKQQSVRKSVKAHSTSCVSLHRSPFHADIAVTAGQHAWKVWMTGGHVDQPVLTSPYATSPLSIVRWSPSRPAVLFVGRQDGILEVWDLLDRSHEPHLAQGIASTAITSLEVLHSVDRTRGTAVQLLAIGDAHGSLHIMELPRKLVRPVQNEVAFMAAFFAREVQRVEYASQRAYVRAEELKVKERAASRHASATMSQLPTIAGKPAQRSSSSITDGAATDDDDGDELDAYEAEYEKLEEAFKQKLGLTSQSAVAV